MPATESKGTGEVTATFDPATKRLSWTGTYSGLTGPVTAAHFHGPAKAGENAGVLVPVTATSSPFSGEATLDDAKAADLEAGRLYFNLHTAANPEGRAPRTGRARALSLLLGARSLARLRAEAGLAERSRDEADRGHHRLDARPLGGAETRDRRAGRGPARTGRGAARPSAT